MIAENKEPEDVAEPRRKIDIQREQRIKFRVLRENWQVSKEERKKIIAEVLAIATDPKEDSRNKIRAANSLIAAVKHDDDKALKVFDKIAPDQHEHTGAFSHEHGITAKELLDAPDYVEWLRQRERDSDPRFIRTNGHEGNCKPVDDGPTRNGH